MAFYSQTSELDLHQLPSSGSSTSTGWENVTNVAADAFSGSSPSVSPAHSSESLGMDSLSATTTSSASVGKNGLESIAFYQQFSDVEKAISNYTKHQPFNHHYAPNVHLNRNNRHSYNNSNSNSNNHNHSNNGNYNNNNRYQNNNANSHHQYNNNGQYKHYNNGRKYQQNNNKNGMMNQQQLQYGSQQQLHQQQMGASRQQQLNNFSQYAPQVQPVITQAQVQQQPQQLPFQQQQQQQQPQHQLNVINNFSGLSLNSNQPNLSYDNLYGSSPSASSSSSPNINTPAHQLNQNLMNSLRGNNNTNIGSESLGMNGFYQHQHHQLNQLNQPTTTASVSSNSMMVSHDIWGMNNNVGVHGGHNNNNGHINHNSGSGNVWA
ncbi:hypothetical protein WICPIJ_001488 [Wickerhamomyces pijperi]|uniref:Uncharacterized protein n=1 Tax=Wickerhamomyces pijperi TaxID=599730 RepID=A0A9P8TQJ4_WICPI|nr:hypothetical protein WICPIJ_001488 [Wickerhamomyces pijperi]